MNFNHQHLHFMGIGGIGISALAALAHSEGAIVSGCDPAENAQTAALAKMGATIYHGHDPIHISADLASDRPPLDRLIYSSAVPATHPEVIAAGDKAQRRGAFLAEILNGRQVIGIAGAHGKTTTTWMISRIFMEAGINPTVLLGGVASPLVSAANGGNFHNGGTCTICEMDESDGSFLLPKIATAVITNIEAEHLAHYQNFENVFAAFTRYASQVASENYVVACLDNPHAAAIFAARSGNKTGYGLDSPQAAANWHAKSLQANAGRQTAEIYHGRTFAGILELPFAGKHNLLNAVAALAVADIYGITMMQALTALRHCPGVGRRWEKIGVYKHAAVYSDYAHHPTEVAATLHGARELDCGRTLVVFQPHLFSRTRDNAKGFAAALALADKVIITDIYPARETPIPGVTSSLITDRLSADKLLTPTPLPAADAVAVALAQADAFATVIIMGAGDVDSIARTAIMRDA